MRWHDTHKDEYEAIINKHVTNKPDKYGIGVIIVEKEKKTADKAKKIMVLDADGHVVAVETMQTIKGSGDTYKGCRLIELSGKEYEVVMTITIKQKPLDKIKPQKKKES